MIRSEFKLGEHKIPMYMGYRLAQNEMSELGINVLNLFSENSNVIQTIMLDDQTMLKVWFFYVDEHLGVKYDEALQLLDETPGGLEPFKQAFWEMVVGFTGPAVRPLAKQAWDQVRQQLKKNLRTLSSDSLDESE